MWENGQAHERTFSRGGKKTPPPPHCFFLLKKWQAEKEELGIVVGDERRTHTHTHTH